MINLKLDGDEMALLLDSVDKNRIRLDEEANRPHADKEVSLVYKTKWHRVQSLLMKLHRQNEDDGADN